MEDSAEKREQYIISSKNDKDRIHDRIEYEDTPNAVNSRSVFTGSTSSMSGFFTWLFFIPINNPFMHMAIQKYSDMPYLLEIAGKLKMA